MTFQHPKDEFYMKRTVQKIITPARPYIDAFFATIKTNQKTS